MKSKAEDRGLLGKRLEILQKKSALDKEKKELEAVLKLSQIDTTNPNKENDNKINTPSNRVCDLCNNKNKSTIKYSYYTGGLYDVKSEINFSMLFNCNYCGGSFCNNHRLPERHDCSGFYEVPLHRKLKPLESLVNPVIRKSHETIEFETIAEQKARIDKYNREHYPEKYKNKRTLGEIIFLFLVTVTFIVIIISLLGI